MDDVDRLLAALSEPDEATIVGLCYGPEPTVLWPVSGYAVGDEAWQCAREAMVRDDPQRVVTADGTHVAAFPVPLVSCAVAYPHLALCAIGPEESGRLCDAANALARWLADVAARRYADTCAAITLAIERVERDQVDARRARQLVKANERLREMNRLKSEFLANVSHELRTPLTSVIGFTSLLLHGTAGDLGEKGRHFAERVLANARTLHGAINDILDFVELSDRSGEPVVSTFEHVRPSLGGKPVELVADLPPDVPALETDRDRLCQVLLHLLGNAVKFTSRGEVRVTAFVAAADPSPRLAISVADTGVGMPRDALP
ncbi:sensor histidine kinase, partial [Planctomycetota bacterium]